ncbi:thermonuclease family protein [Ottowia sp.]|uniref:thermonuclease family protein n=1 Tax=Ottowia sp. TaxID=1898956 RepID=UPI0025EC89C9|nr:thermonuclease family protein [Ottowia sp.]
MRVRLAEIDAPERKQPFGNVSRQHLAALCFKTEATIRQTATDRYGRTVARVECRGRDADLVERHVIPGHPHYTRPPGVEPLYCGCPLCWRE